MAVANCHGGVACVLCVTMPSHFIFESSDNWLNTHKADWRWPITILLIGRDGQSRGQRVLAGGVLDFTHGTQILQCTLGFVKKNYWSLCCLQPLPQHQRLNRSVSSNTGHISQSRINNDITHKSWTISALLARGYFTSTVYSKLGQG